jgi:two-component system, chemotaxis family, sensor kinase CheA
MHVADIREQLLAAFDVEHREHVDALRAALARVRAGDAHVDVRELLRRAHSLKGAARAVDARGIEDAAHDAEQLLADVHERGEQLRTHDAARIAALLDDIERHAATLYGRDAAQHDGEQHAAPHAAHEPAHEVLRVSAAQVQRLTAAMHDVAAHLDALDADVLRDLHVRADALARYLEHHDAQQSAHQSAPQAAQGIAQGIAQVMQQAVQQARALSRTLAHTMRAQKEAAQNSINAANRLREEIERVAMAPVSSVFAGLDVMLRDLAGEAGRQVEVRLEGMDVQADRQLLQSLRDPVIHLLRNAIAHGIETPLERIAAGKPETGEIGLKVQTRAGRVELSVFDDGRGPNLEQIEDVAVQRGLISPRKPGELPPPADRLLALAFEPGFSTASSVDRVSGRGMGLSVVAEAARRGGGGAYMRHRLPWGTEVVISAPLSAARQPVLLAHQGERIYGLPTRAVERVLHMKREELERLDGREVIKLHEGGNQIMVPTVSLGQIAGSVGTAGEDTELVNIAVLRQGDLRLGVRVDAFSDVRTATVTALTHPDIDDLVQGAMQLEQDAVAIVLNPEALMRRHSRNQHGPVRAAAPAARKREQVRRTILVVDDSVTTRTLQKNILEAAGFKVLLAVDGVDALERLQTATSPVDLIVADVEMPQMDGFQLLAALKADSRFSKTPVIMMTSRAAPEDVRRGMELGAEAYLVKQTFEQKELLSTIGQLM